MTENVENIIDAYGSPSEKPAAFYRDYAQYDAIVKNPKRNRELKIQGRAPTKYADLAAILEASLPHLAAYGMSFAQDVQTTFEDGTAYVRVNSYIYHQAGHSEHFGPLVIPCANNAQAIGSAITYARRYAAQAALGLAADDDDDATTSDGHGGSSEEPSRGGNGGSSGKGETVSAPLDKKNCLHLHGTRPVTKGSGETIDVCVDCGRPIEAVA